MNNNIHIETVLDELVKNRIIRSDAEELLEKENVSDAVAEINLHLASVKAIQRYNVLKQVQSVHAAYIPHGIKQESAKITEARNLPVIKMRPVKWAIRIAASVILFISAWFTYQYSNTNSNKLYSEIYQPYKVNTDRGIGDITTHNMVNEFKARNFQAVITTYESLGKTNNREKFLSAYAYIETGNYDKAAGLLQQILDYNKENNQRLYNDEAEFYSGLCFLKKKDNKTARLFFEAIRNNPNHTFNERVSKWTITRLKWLH